MNDVTRQGSFGEEWLVVTKDRLLVYEPNGVGPKLRVDVPLSELRSPSADSLVGGGALQATVNGETIELVRYSNARQRTFSRVAKYLTDVAAAHEALAKGEAAKGTLPPNKIIDTGVEVINKSNVADFKQKLAEMKK